MRKIVVEPVIGDIKENYGFIKFYLRGLEKVKIELNLISITHNLKKIYMLRRKINSENERCVKNIDFCLILDFNYLNCDPACLSLLSLVKFKIFIDDKKNWLKKLGVKNSKG